MKLTLFSTVPLLSVLYPLPFSSRSLYHTLKAPPLPSRDPYTLSFNLYPFPPDPCTLPCNIHPFPPDPSILPCNLHPFPPDPCTLPCNLHPSPPDPVYPTL
ncbi:hypothetical protein PoB_006671300 [Plakobranchus ocellatus]|uniref:Uncharacterized protein n=1 Tax=Plakobranchus ocellatus TaxID=259542 RepID=A0AAV4D817_9GAST|nr:hypothetical protein PoB_006671300 [Plakobranchus ocellatus]